MTKLDTTGLKPLDVSGLTPLAPKKLDASGLKPLDTTGLTPLKEEGVDRSMDRWDHAGSQFQRGFGEVVASVPKSIGIAARAVQRSGAEGTYSHADEALKEATDLRERMKTDPRVAEDPQIAKGYEIAIAEAEKRGQMNLERWTRMSAEGAYKPAEETAMFKAGEEFSKETERNNPVNPEFEGEFVADTLPGGAGSMAGFVSAGMVGRATGIPAWLTTAIAGSSAAGAGGYEDARDSGAGINDAVDSYFANAGLGTLEAVPIARALDKLDRYTGGGVQKILREGFKGGLEELLQEVVQTVGSNLIASDLVAYDQERGTFEGVGEAAGAGFTLGAVLNLLTSSLGNMRHRRRSTPNDQGEPGPLPEPTPETPTQPVRTRADLERDLNDPRSVDEIRAESAKQADEASEEAEQDNGAPDPISGQSEAQQYDDLPEPDVILPETQPEETQHAQKVAQVDAAAQEAATSPVNDLPEPTQAQKEAGNYKKGHVSIDGLDIAIENPKGSVRSGTDANGQPWQVVMNSHYGYIKRSEGADGDHVDVFVNTESPIGDKVYIVDQVIGGKFDEHKVVMGADSEAEARAVYLENYKPGWDGIGAISEVPMEDFKTWIKDGGGKQPYAWKPASVQGKAFDTTGLRRLEDAAPALRENGQESNLNRLASQEPVNAAYGRETSAEAALFPNSQQRSTTTMPQQTADFSQQQYDETTDVLAAEAMGGNKFNRFGNSSAPQGAAKENLKRDQARFAHQVNAVMSGTHNHGRVLVSETPLVFKLLGYKRFPLYMNASAVRKVLVDKHGLPQATFKKLPTLLSDPVAVFNSSTQQDSLVVMLNAKDADGDTVVAAIHKAKGTLRFHKLASVYGKDFDTWFAGEAAAGRLLYANKKKLQGWSVRTGVSFPGGSHPGATNKIVTEADLVNLRSQSDPGHYRKSAPEAWQQGAVLDDKVVELIHKIAQQVAPKVNVEVVDRLLSKDGRQVFGRWRASNNLISVALNQTDPVATLNHEAIHALRSLGLFTPQEWNLLERKARRDWMNRYDVASLYADQSKQDQIEEAIAQAYAEYAAGGKQVPMVRKIFDRIKQLINRLGNALRGMGFQTVDDVFGRVQQGQVGARSQQSATQGGEKNFRSKTDLTASPEFRKWFGDSKVVDGNGEPLVVYHGTKNGSFEAFDADKLGSNTKSQSAAEGFFFSGKQETAMSYTDKTTKESVRKQGLSAISLADKSVNSLVSWARMKNHDFYARLKGSKTFVFSGDRVVLADDFDETVADDFYDHSSYLDEVHETIGRIADDFGIGVRIRARSTISRIKNAKEKLDGIAIEEEPNSSSGSVVNSFYLKIENPLISDQGGKKHRDESYYDIIRRAKKENHDGVIIRDTFDGGPIDDVYVVFSPEQIKSVDNRGTFDPNDPRIKYSLFGEPKDMDSGPRMADVVGRQAAEAIRERGKARQFLNKVTKEVRDWRNAAPLPHMKDLNWMSQAVIHPRTIAQLYPHFTPVWQAATRMFERRDTINAELSRLWEPYHKLEDADKAEVNKVLELGRLQGESYKGDTVTATNKLGNASLTEIGEVITLNKKQVEGYYAVRGTMDKALELFLERTLEEWGFGGPQDPKTAKGLEDLAKEMDKLSRKADLDEQAREFQRKADDARKLAQIVAEIERSKMHGYVPFTRYGNYGIAVRDSLGGVVHFEKIEAGGAVGRTLNRGKAAKVKRRLLERYPANKGYRVGNVVQVTNASDLQALNIKMSDIDALAEFMNLQGEDWASVREKMFEGTKKLGFRKHFIGASNVSGYSTDFERSVADYITGISAYLARRETNEAFEEAQAAIPERQPKLREYSKRYVDYVQSPQEELHMLRTVGFFYYLSGNVSSAAVNLSQVPLVTGPYLTQFTGEAAVTREMLRAYKDTAKMMGSLREESGAIEFFNPDKAPADVRDALKAAWDSGYLVPLTTLDQMGVAHNRQKYLKGVSNKTRQAVELAGSMFSGAERANRIVSFIAAYRLAKNQKVMEKAGKILGDNPLWQAEAKDFTPEAFARWVIDETHFRMGKINRPRFFRGPGAALLQFKSFTVNMLELQYRLAVKNGPEGKKALAYLIGGMVATAGVWGIPFGEDLREIIEALYAWATEKDLDLERELREVIYATTGSALLAEGVNRGALRSTGVDMSRRLGMGGILPTDTIKSFAGGEARGANDIFGIPWDLTLGRGGQAAEYWKRDQTALALGEVMPTFIRNPIHAYSWATDGIRSQTTGRVFMTADQLNGLDIALKAIGFTPTKVTRAREKHWTQYRIGQAVRDLQANYYTKLAMAIADGDRDRVAELRAEIAEHNRSAEPHEKIAIKPQTLRKRVVEERRGKVGNLKRLPKKARSGASETGQAYPD